MHEVSRQGAYNWRLLNFRKVSLKERTHWLEQEGHTAISKRIPGMVPIKGGKRRGRKGRREA